MEWNKIGSASEKDEIWTKEISFTLDPVLNIGPFVLLAKWISDSDFLLPLSGPCCEFRVPSIVPEYAINWIIGDLEARGIYFLIFIRPVFSTSFEKRNWDLKFVIKILFIK